MGRPAAVVVALLLLLSGCGSDEAKAKRSMADVVYDDNYTRAQARCIADGLVDRLGTDKLKQYDLLADDLEPSGALTTVKMSEDDASKAADVFVGCVDVGDIFENLPDADLSPSVIACLKQQISQEDIRQVFQHALMGDSDAGDAIREQAIACIQGESSPSP